MLEKIIRFSIQQKWFVFLGTLLLVGVGLYSLKYLPIDAVPDITNVQVQINTSAPGYSPFEVEQLITYPIETVMAGLPNLEETRSLSRYGLSQVTVIFKDGTDIYFARQLVNERIQDARGVIPQGIDPMMGPIATGLGEIFMWTVESKEGAKRPDGQPYSLTNLRTIQDWIIKPQMRNVPGVTEVNTIGGYDRQFHVTPYPEKLIAYSLTFRDIVQALGHNNDNVGAGYIEHAGEQYLVRAPGQVSNIEEIEQVIVTHNEGVPVYVRDVANVVEGHELRTGAATANGKEEVVGTVFMLMGENSRTVAYRVSEKMKEVNKTLPEGVVAEPVYNRMNLVDATIHTVAENLFLGALFVVLVLFLFLGNIRAALITAFVIPLSMLFTITGMVQNKMSANLMSLGALDFGIIIDGAVIVIENCIRRLGQERNKLKRSLTVEERESVVLDASSEVRRATIFGELIIMIVYLPILTLTGIEGKMFVPMALTVVMALIGAMILSLTFIPAAVAFFLSKDIEVKELPVMRIFKKAYRPTLSWSFRHPMLVLVTAVSLVAVTGLMSLRMGREFIPRLDEGDMAMQVVRLPGISISQAVKMQEAVEKRILEFPEVLRTFSKIGTAEIASDPMPPNVADTFIMLKGKSDWPDPKKPKNGLVSEIEAAVLEIPGNAYEFTQPIELRFNELISGVRSDIAVKLFGDDLSILLEHAQEISAVLSSIKGASDVRVEQIGGLPMLTVNIDRQMLARYGLNMEDVQEAVEIAIGGMKSGQVFEGDKRFDLVVRLPEDIRNNTEIISNIPIMLPQKSGGMVGTGQSNFLPLGAVAKLKLAPGPNQISRENGKRRIVVSVNVRGRDIGRFVADAQESIDQEIKLPPGYWIDWGGQFEQMISAAKRLTAVVPMALFLIFVLLFAALGTVKDAWLVFTCVPLALTGGILALFFRGIPFSISAGIGFIALSGVAVLDGLVMITFIKKLREQGEKLHDAVFNGAIARLRPVLMTSFVAALGFVPMALSVGRGAEVQRPLATVVIGGLISSTLLTLIVIPVLYRIINRQKGEIK